MVILCVDDDADDRDLFIDALRHIDESIICLTASNGEEALDVLASDLELPDYIFLDINMPKMGGKELISKIRMDGRLDDIPVVIISTSSATKEIQEFITLGAADFIIKPPDFGRLIQTITNVLSSLQQKLYKRRETGN